MSSSSSTSRMVLMWAGAGRRGSRDRLALGHRGREAESRDGDRGPFLVVRGIGHRGGGLVHGHDLAGLGIGGQGPDLFFGLGKGGLDRGRRVAPVLVHAPGQLEEKLLRVDPVVQGFEGDVALAHHLGRARGEAEVELPFPQANELLEGDLDPAADGLAARAFGEGRDPRLHGQAVPGERGHHEAVEEDDPALAFLRPDSQVPRLLAEGDDLQNVEEGQVLEIAREAHLIFASSAAPDSPKRQGKTPSAGPTAG